MDLRIPYTLYPTALPHTLAWGLFIAAFLASGLVSYVIGKRRSLKSAVLLFLPVLFAFLVLSILLAVIYMLFRS